MSLESATSRHSSDPSRDVRESGPVIAIGTRLGRYEVVRSLGEGGMGIVYVGYDAELDRCVALKVLRGDAPTREWLLREAQALARLAHPNIVSVHEVGEWEGRSFLAMELVEGPTLRLWLTGERSFSEILAIFRQAARGLAAAHRAGLVHRDFKPENVLIGHDGRARVADFGIVTKGGVPTNEREGRPSTPSLPKVDALASPLTQTGALLGTPAYMSPEQFLGERVTVQSDQFAFCVALYRAVFRSNPFEATSALDYARAVTKERARAPEPRADAPAWLWPILARGLERMPSARFDSMDDLLRAIDEHVPRDPELDPTVIALDRRVVSVAFLVCYMCSTLPMLTEAGRAVLTSKQGLLGAPLVDLLVVSFAIAVRYKGLSRNRNGRRFMAMLPLGLATLLFQRIVGVSIGLDARQVLVQDVMLCVVLWTVLSVMYDRWLYQPAVIAAATIAGCALMPSATFTLYATCGVLVVSAFARQIYLTRREQAGMEVGYHESLGPGTPSSEPRETETAKQGRARLAFDEPRATRAESPRARKS